MSFNFVIFVCSMVCLASPAQADSYEANCALFSENTIIEASSCKATILNTTGGDEGGGGNLINYQWENGRVTVTQNVEAFFTINGKDGETVFTKDGYDLCVKNLDDQTIFCTGQVAKTVAPQGTELSRSLFSKYPDWADYAWCELRAQDDYRACRAELTQCERDNEHATISCPELGICSYASKGELKSKSACLLKNNISANGKAWIGDFKWQNGNRVELVEFQDAFQMNDVSVIEQKSGAKRCYYTKGKTEEFCFLKEEAHRFSGALAEFTEASGVWLTQGTTCTNKLYPIDGGIAVLENSFFENQESLLYWTDDIHARRQMGIESNSCHIFDVKNSGKGTLSANFKCGGESIENETEAGIDRANGTMIIKLKPYEELILVMHGEKKRYVQCQS